MTPTETVYQCTAAEMIEGLEDSLIETRVSSDHFLAELQTRFPRHCLTLQNEQWLLLLLSGSTVPKTKTSWECEF